jgi:hypothetical protein
MLVWCLWDPGAGGRGHPGSERGVAFILISWATLPGQNPKRAMESLELFARQVMPVVRAATGGEE